MRTEDFRLQNLPHDLYHAVKRKVANGKKAVSLGKEINGAGPKNEAAAKKG